MTPADQLAHFSGGTDDLAMSGLWYSHKRVTELVQAAKAEGAAEAVDALARVRALHHRREWQVFKDMATFGQSVFPDQCDHCRTSWPCDTAAVLESK